MEPHKFFAKRAAQWRKRAAIARRLPMPSPLAPIQPALDRTRLVLFTRYDIEKWITLGFCSFLAAIGQSGGGFGFHYNFNNGAAPKIPNFGQAEDWIRAHAVILAIAGLALFCVMIAMGLIVGWLSARGRFMFLSNVARDQAKIKEPWTDFRAEAWSLFWFKFFLSLAAFVILIALGGCLAVIAIGTGVSKGRLPGHGALFGAAIGVGIALIFCFSFLMLAIHTLMEDFIVPIQYLRRTGTLEAIGIFREELAAGRSGEIALYVIVRWLVGAAVSLAAIITMLCTCCFCLLGLLPFISSVFLLPFAYFKRCYAMYYLEQFGPEWRLFAPAPEAVEPGVPWTPNPSGPDPRDE
jgi:hypothetical protein